MRDTSDSGSGGSSARGHGLNARYGGDSGPSARDLGLSQDVTRPVPDAAATPTPVPIPVLYEDDVLLVVNKPAGLATMPRGRYVARSVVAQVRWARGDERIVAAHRLDRLTSGVLVLVKDPAWRGRVQTLFERRVPGLRKRYVARTPAEPAASPYTAAGDLVAVRVLGGEGRAAGVAAASAPATVAAEPVPEAGLGAVPQDLGCPFEVALPLLKRPGQWQCRVDPAGRSSRTVVLRRELAERGPADRGLPWSDRARTAEPGATAGRDAAVKACVPAEAGMVEGDVWARSGATASGCVPAGSALTWHLELRTGYTHQLRVTLAALGYPILGDPLYPEVSPLYTSDAGDAVRMDLHAAALTLPSLDGAPSWPSFAAPAPWLTAL